MENFENNQASNQDAHGGARKGAGRKLGSTTKRTREIADRLMSDGLLSPLEFMLNLMRGEAPKDADAATIVHHWQIQFEAAKAAAPYIHPRLAAIEHTGRDGVPLIPPVLDFAFDR